MPSAYDSPEYKRNRATILEGSPICHWCKRAPATQADHLIEIDRGGDHSLEGLVPSCGPCNFKRGQRYKAQRDQQRTHARNEHLRDIGTPIPDKTSKPLFYTDTTSTPTLLFSPRNGHDQQGLASISHDLPRLETDWSDAAGTFGPEVGGWAETYLRKTLYPWQLRALSGQLSYDVNGKFLHRNSLVSTARQNGKTIALMSLIGWFCTDHAKRQGNPVKVLSTAHRLDVAVELFNELAPILVDYFGAKAVNQYGRNEVRFLDGSRWLVRAAGPSVGHSLSLSLVVADEIWDISREAIDGGLLPTMRAQPNPLFSAWSTAGTEASDVFLRWREQGLRAIDQKKQTSLYMAEWSPPPDLDPMTPAAWQFGNPSLGHNLEMETIQAESENPDRASFLRAAVNIWVASAKGWIGPGIWPQLHYEGELPRGGTVAVETSMDETRYFGVRCVALPDRRVVATVEFMADTFAQAIEYCTTLALDPQIRFAITPTVDLHWPTSLERRRVVVGYGEILKYTPAVKNMINEKLLWHTGEAHLAEHVNRAVAVRSQGSIALSSQRSPGPIELARCMVWAAALTSRPMASGKPMLVVAS